MVKFLALLLLVILLVVWSLGGLIYATKRKYPRLSWERCAKYVKTNLVKVFRVFFPRKYVRFSFDLVLQSMLAAEIKDYKNPNFQAYIQQCGDMLPPLIWISFVPNKRYNEEELNDLRLLLEKQFDRYLASKKIVWKHFSTLEFIDNEIIIRIYYCELPSDNEAYTSEYNSRKALSVPLTPGNLVDDSLNAEIRHAGSNRV